MWVKVWFDANSLDACKVVFVPELYTVFFNTRPFSHLELTEILSKRGLAPLEPNMIVFVMVTGVVPKYF